MSTRLWEQELTSLKASGVKTKMKCFNQNDLLASSTLKKYDRSYYMGL